MDAVAFRVRPGHNPGSVSLSALLIGRHCAITGYVRRSCGRLFNRQIHRCTDGVNAYGSADARVAGTDGVTWKSGFNLFIASNGNLCVFLETKVSRRWCIGRRPESTHGAAWRPTAKLPHAAYHRYEWWAWDVLLDIAANRCWS